MVGSSLAHYHCLRTESLDRRLLQSSMTMTTDTEEVLNSKQLLRRKRYKSSSSKQLSCDGERDSDDDVTNSFDHAAVPSSEIINSLNKINGQLGEVLTRLGHPSTTTTGTASSIQPYPSIDPLLQARKPDKNEEELCSKWQYNLGHVTQQTPSSSVMFQMSVTVHLVVALLLQLILLVWRTAAW